MTVASCASAPEIVTLSSDSHFETISGQKLLQCVPYAREHSAIKIYGDAWTWWDQASGKYERGQAPARGTVMVLTNYAGPNQGHVAVVKRIVSSREIRIDHANWFNDGSIYVNNPVMDVSAANDWSQVRVYNIQTGGWGSKIYPVQGFIGSGSNRPLDNSKRALSLSLQTSKPVSPKPAPRAPVIEEDALSDALTSDTEALIAHILADKKKSAITARAETISKPAAAIMPVAARATDLNPPAGSPFELTAEDLSIP